MFALIDNDWFWLKIEMTEVCDSEFFESEYIIHMQMTRRSNTWKRSE